MTPCNSSCRVSLARGKSRTRHAVTQTIENSESSLLCVKIQFLCKDVGKGFRSLRKYAKRIYSTVSNRTKKNSFSAPSLNRVILQTLMEQDLLTLESATKFFTGDVVEPNFNLLISRSYFKETLLQIASLQCHVTESLKIFVSPHPHCHSSFFKIKFSMKGLTELYYSYLSDRNGQLPPIGNGQWLKPISQSGGARYCRL